VPILAAEHDLAHPVEDDPAWSESYYFNAYDQGTDSGLFTRIGIRPNEGTIDVGLSIWLPGGGLAEYRAVREQTEMIDSDLELGGVRYRMLEEMKRWRLTADCQAFLHDGPGSVSIALDVTFEGLTPAIGVAPEARPAAGAASDSAGNVGRGHLEQAGRWQGTLAVDRDEYQWASARGNRDKSWGPRRWEGPTMWRWFSINIDDETHFGGIRLATGAGELHRGWVWTGGQPASIRDWTLQTDLASDGLTHRALELTATDKQGRCHVLNGEVLRVAPVPYERDGHTTLINEGLTRWTYGGVTGFGISEYLHQLGPDGKPVVPVT
jgi:hypothetical protein